MNMTQVQLHAPSRKQATVQKKKLYLTFNNQDGI